MLIILGIDVCNGEYEVFGVFVMIFVNFLGENGVVLEKCDFNFIFFLLILVEDMVKF